MQKIAAFFFLLPLCLPAQQVKHILFIGNSYTYVNNLPDMITQLALAGGDSVNWDSNTPGGYSLILHTQDTTTRAKINLRPWDYVVIQGQSQEAAIDTPFVETSVFPYARMLDSLVHVNDSCTQTIFYMTWGRKYGDASYCPQYPPVCTYAGMQAQLKGRYLQMAHDNHAIVAPVGCAWQSCIAVNPPFDLYQADQSHPSVYGTYLAACTFYATIFRQSPAGLTYYGGLTQNEATLLQNIAASTVLDSMPLWNTNVYYPSAVFSGTITGVNTASCTATDTTATSWSWDDGSGFVPGASTQSFTFAGSPPYTICLAVSNGCRTDTLCQVIQPMSIVSPDESGFSVGPVPAGDCFFILNEKHRAFTYRLFSSEGRLVAEGSTQEEKTTIPTNQLPPGVYLLQIGANGIYTSTAVPVTPR